MSLILCMRLDRGDKCIHFYNDILVKRHEYGIYRLFKFLLYFPPLNNLEMIIDWFPLYYNIYIQLPTPLRLVTLMPIVFCINYWNVEMNCMYKTSMKFTFFSFFFLVLHLYSLIYSFLTTL